VIGPAADEPDVDVVPVLMFTHDLDLTRGEGPWVVDVELELVFAFHGSTIPFSSATLHRARHFRGIEPGGPDVVQTLDEELVDGISSCHR